MDGKFLILIFVGLFLVDSTDGVSGGRPYLDNSFVVAIYNSRHDYICTGTIVSLEAAITSASCLGYYADFNESSRIDKNHRMALFARVYNTDRRKKDHEILIEELKKHHDWDPEKPDNDVAVIKPKGGFDKDIAMIISFPYDDTNISYVGKEVYSYGWGASRENFPNEYLLQRTQSNIKSMDVCKEKYPDEDLDDKRFLCTHKRGSGACSGDDGGPVIASAHYDPPYFVLFGIIGFRKGCGYPEYPDVHTHALDVKKFVKNHTEISEY